MKQANKEQSSSRTLGANKTQDLTQSQKLEEVRAPIYAEVMADNPALTKEELAEMMDEMGF